jgi:hypothetical protein
MLSDRNIWRPAGGNAIECEPPPMTYLLSKEISILVCGGFPFCASRLPGLDGGVARSFYIRPCC